MRIRKLNDKKFNVYVWYSSESKWSFVQKCFCTCAKFTDASPDIQLINEKCQIIRRGNIYLQDWKYSLFVIFICQSKKIWCHNAMEGGRRKHWIETPNSKFIFNTFNLHIFHKWIISIEIASMFNLIFLHQFESYLECLSCINIFLSNARNRLNNRLSNKNFNLMFSIMSTTN